MASSAKRKRGTGPTPEINVTPLVDVVLVLLIIFMVIAPQLEGGLRVEVPGVFHPDPKLKGSLEPLTVTVNGEGAVFIDKSPVTAAELETTLRDRRAADPRQRVLLKGDQTLRYEVMRDLFALCQRLGFPGVSLVVSDRARRGDDGDDARADPRTQGGGARGL
jgi:biopolymer transport protein ExbD/biopolymer transport protein TolR